MNAFVYILRCRDDRYYVGTTRGSLEHRVAEHNDGTFGGFTKSRRPVELVYSESFDRITDAIRVRAALERLGQSQEESLDCG